MGFCCFCKPDLVMDSSIRKGWALVIERRQSMTFFYMRRSEMNEAKYVLPTRMLNDAIKFIVERGTQQEQLDIVTKICLDIDHIHYREVMRAIGKAIYATGDEASAGRLSRGIIRGADTILDRERPRSDIQKLCG